MSKLPKLKERALNAADAYLERVGMTVVEVDYKTASGTIPILAIDDDVLVHVTVNVSKGSAPEPYDPTRATARKHRQRVMEYQAKMRLDVPVRFDVITIMVIADDRALLRHHRAAYTDKEV